MSSHVELNPDDSTLGLSLGMKAMRLALTQKTHKMGTVRIPGTGGTDVIIGAGASDGANRIDQDGRQLPIVDTSGIDKAAQDAQQSADKAMTKADEAIAKGEQIRRDAQAGIDDARKQAQAAAAKADKVRTDLETAASQLESNIAAVDKKADQVRSDLTQQMQDAKSEMDSTVGAAQSSADKAQSAADAAQKAADKANASTAGLDKTVQAVDAKAVAAKQAAAEARSKAENVASDLDSANAVIEQHTTELGELTTKVSNAVKKSDSALSVSTEAKQTATEASTTASSAYRDSQTALTQSTTATQTATAAKTTAESASKTATDSLKQSSAAVQTANQISTTLRTEYQTKAAADKIYATQSSLKQTSDSITASVSKTYATKDALSSLQNVADNAIESWRGTGVPTLTNRPASDWTTDAKRKKHSGDLYYDKSTGKAYRFGSDDGVTYTWELNQDTDVTKALADASKAQTSANNAQASATAANTAAGKAQSTANTAVSNAVTAKNAADAAQSSANKAQGDVDKLKIDIPATYATKSSLTQTAESITANVESVKKTANSAVTAASKAQQTADGISVNLTKNYQTKSQADTIYATKASLKATSDSISAEVTKAQGTADGAVTAASKAQQTADAVTLNLSKNYNTKAQNDAVYATKTSLKVTSDSLSASISSTAKTAQSAVDKATSLEANLNGFKSTVSQTYTTKTDFNNLTIGGRNLLVKSNFIKSYIDLSNGTLSNPGGSVSDSTYNGDSSTKNPIPVDSNTTYILSAYDSMRDTTSNTGRISQFNSKGNFIGFAAHIDLRDKGNIVFTTASNAASILVGIYSFPRYRWKLEKGTKPTDWSPAPEDLQPSGDYATNSSLTQTANSIKAQVTEVSKTANSAMSKATTVEQTANGLSSKITEQGKTLNATVTTANEAKSTADSNKTAISQVSTTASSALSKASTVEQNLDGFKTAVSQTYGRGSNLWVNPTFDPDKPQITTRVNNVTAPNGSGVNLLANRDHYNGSTGFPVVPGHVYVITAHIKRIKGNLDLLADIWYTEMTSGVSYDSHVIKEPTVELTDGWSLRTWRVTCSNGKSKGCVNFRIDQWDHSTQWYVANLVCVDVTGLQPAGDYATNSSLTQTANSIKAQVTEVSKTASGAMSKATTVEQTANGLSTRITEQAKTLGATVKTANEAKSTADSNKTTISQTSNLVNAALAGDNLITDGGFESTAWWMGLKAPFRLSNGSFYHGAHVLVCDAATGDNRCPLTHAKGMVGTATAITVTKGRTYRLSGYCAWYLSVPSNVNPSGDKLRLAKPDGTYIAEAQCGKSTSWSETHVDWKCPDDGSITSVRIEVMHQANGTILWDDVSFQDITEAAATSTRVASVEQNLNGFKTSVADTYQPKSGMGGYATQSQLTQTANQIRGEVSEKYQSKDGMGSYATNSALTQKANEITGKVQEVAKTTQGNTTTISQVSQKADKINTTLSQKIDGKADVSRVSSLEQSLSGFKTTVAQSYQPKGDYPTRSDMQSSISQTASSIKSEVANTYTTSAATEALRKSSTRTFTMGGANGKAKWVKLGYLTSNGDSSSVLLHVYSGNGYNGLASQNAEFEIFVKDGWQQSPSATGAFGVSVSRICDADGVKVKVMAFSSTTCDIWAYLPWAYWNGHYTLQGDYKSWQDGPNCGDTRIQDAEPTNGTAQNLAYDTLSTHSYVDQTAKSVALGVVQNYKGADGSGLATKSDITVAKNSITSTVAGTYATKSGVTQEISSKIVQNNNSLDVRFATKTETKTAQDTASTAKSNASNAQARVGALEDCISLTSAGVRAGHKSNGVFAGVSALVNTDGSFDLLDKDGKLITRIDRHSLQVAGDHGVGSGHLILSQDGLDITVQPTANKKATYHIRLGAGGISITAPDGSHINCSARTGLDLETVRYGKLSIGSGGLQFTNDQGWGLGLSAAGWSMRWAGNHTLATGPTAGKLYIDGHEIVTK